MVRGGSAQSVSVLVTVAAVVAVVEGVGLAVEVGGAPLAAVVVIVAVAGRDGEAVLAVGAGRPNPGLGRGFLLDGRGRRLAEGRMQVLVSAELGLVVDVGVVDERDVVDEVIDEELRVGHEVVDGVAGLWLLSALVQRTTEGFHHSHLSGAGGDGGGAQEK